MFLSLVLKEKIRVRGKGLVGVVRLGNNALFDVPHLRDGHGLNPSMGWVGSHFPAHVMGWVVGLNEKYCGIVAEYCKTHTFHCT